MKELLEYLLKLIVKNEKDIEVTEVDEDNKVLLKVKANPEDIGLIIGKKGRIIRSLRNILKVKAIKEGKIIEIKIEDDKKEDNPPAIESS